MSLLRVSLLLALLGFAALVSVRAASDDSLTAPSVDGDRREVDAEATLPTCPAGSWPASSSPSHKCAGGQSPVTPISGTGQCCSCYAGGYSTQGSQQCGSCGTLENKVNTAAPPSSQGYCFCADGWGFWVKPTTGQPSCTQQCPIGTYNSRTDPQGLYPGNLGCRACPVGKSTTAIGATECITIVQCPANQYPNAAGNCLACPTATTDGTTATTNVCKCKAGFQNWNGNTASCTQCPIGTAGSDGTCTQCPAGTFAATAGQSTCTPCTAGTASTTVGRTTACPACDAGRVAQNAGSQTCTPCDAGKASKGSATTCTACGNGEWSTSAAATCNTCAPGRAFTGSERTSECEACPVGQEQPSSGAATCTACAAGKVASAQGTASCSPCGQGKFAASASAQCENCAAGKWAGPNANGNVQCTECVANTKSTAVGATAVATCTACGEGLYSNAGATGCVSCGPNRYFAIADSACTNCPAGKTSTSPVQADGSNPEGSCTACSPGQYGDVAGAGCSNCPQGRFSVSSTQCDLCPAGTYGATAGLSSSAECTTTTPGYKSKADGTGEEICPKGTYANLDQCSACTGNDYAPSEGSATCQPCPQNTMVNEAKDDCEGCKAGTRLNTATSLCELCLQGTFSTIDGALECETCATIDDGAAWSLENARATNSFIEATAQTGNTKCWCAPGYTRKASDWAGSTDPDFAGEHCTVHNCAPGQYLSDGEGPSKCTPCPENYFCASPVGCGIGVGSCTKCADNAHTNGKSGQAACVCKGLGTAVSDIKPLTGLPQHAVSYYVADQIGDAAPNPLISLTDEQALAAGANCNPVCRQGEYYQLEDNKCHPCPMDTYCPPHMAFGCIEGGCLPCVGAGVSSGSQPGSTRCDCKSGFEDQFGDDDGAGCTSVLLARH